MHVFTFNLLVKGRNSGAYPDKIVSDMSKVVVLEIVAQSRALFLVIESPTNQMGGVRQAAREEMRQLLEEAGSTV